MPIVHIELQYIEASKGNGSIYDQLLQALADKIAAGVEGCISASADYAEKWGEKMKAAGVDLTANIHTYPDVHNKGFVIDGKTVIVSGCSRPLRESGMSQRDAGIPDPLRRMRGAGAVDFGPILYAGSRARALTVLRGQSY